MNSYRTCWVFINYAILILLLSCASSDTKGTEYVEEGNSLLSQGHIEQAIAAFNLAIEDNPNQAETYVIRGISYLSIDPNKSLQDFNKAISIDDTYANAYLQRGIYYFNRGVALQNSADLKLSMADFDKTIEIEPSNSDAFNRRARTHILSGNYTQGLFDLDSAILHNPLNAEAIVDRGILLGSLAKEDGGVDPELKQASCVDLANVARITDDQTIIEDAEKFGNIYNC